jgi:hypothetical protein
MGDEINKEGGGKTNENVEMGSERKWRQER